MRNAIQALPNRARAGQLAAVLTLLIALSPPSAAVRAPRVDYLADTPHVIEYHQQAWGELGLNTCAHAAGQTALPLRIATRDFSRGLGHHAPGEIIVDLDGRYARFEVEVGVQRQQGSVGTVVFRVFVDGRERFDSGVMREADEARPVSVDVTGASELRLVADDAGDGIVCDCANWANARLVEDPDARARPRPPGLDIAPFAATMRWDPDRMDGARSGRTEEFRAEDIFLGQRIAEPARGPIVAHGKPSGPAAIGLEWIERRVLREARIEFAAGTTPPDPARCRVEGWVGDTAFQGKWQPFASPMRRGARALGLAIDWSADPWARAGIRKLRWVLPPRAAGWPVARLVALSAGRTQTARLRLEATGSARGPITVEVYNGAVLAGGVARRQWRWDPARAAAIRVRCAAARRSHADDTVLRFRTPSGMVSVAVVDALERGPVYVPDAGLYVVRADGPNPEAYRRSIRDRRTVLAAVRAMPEQTRERAMLRTANPLQRRGPVMLSLACDNRKFVVPREGGLQFDPRPEEAGALFASTPARMAGVTARFGDTPAVGIARTFDVDTAAIETRLRAGRVDYAQRTFVAPVPGDGAPGPLRGTSRPLCVAEVTARVGRAGERATVELAFTADAATNAPLTLQAADGHCDALEGERLLARVDWPAGWSAETNGARLTLRRGFGTPGASTFRLRVPGWRVAAGEGGTLPADGLLDAARTHWATVMRQAMTAEVPDPFVQRLMRASQIHCLMAARSDGETVAPWIASMHYGPLESEANSILRGMAMFGHEEFCRRGLDYFIARYSPSGSLTTGYTLMGTGWHLRTLGEFVRLYPDAAWTRSVAPDVARVCAWILRQRAKTEAGRVGHLPEAGLMPPGVMADWGAYSYYFCLNGYYDAGLRGAAEVLAAAGSSDAASVRRAAEAFRKDILRAYSWARERTPVVPLRDGTWVRSYPSQVYCLGPTGNYYPGEDGNRSWCYDVELGAHHLVGQGVLEARSREVAEMMDHMEDVQFLSDGWFDYPAAASRKDWFDLGGFSKVQPYYTRNAEVYALRDDVEPFVRSYFNTLAAMVSPENLTFWEHFHNAGAWNKTHETGYFLQQSRTMLVQERPEAVWLAPFTPRAWLADGKVIDVDRGPTKAGRVSYRLASRVRSGYVDGRVTVPGRPGATAVAVRLRVPGGARLLGADVRGARLERCDANGEYLLLRPTASTVTFRARFGGAARH